MTKNPIINAFAATLYITAVASFMFYGSRVATGEDTFIVPIAMISLLTLSAAVMAYVFFYQPIQLLIEGEKKRAASLLVQTIAAFASITAVIFLALLSSSLF